MKLNVAVPFNRIVGLENAFIMTGGATTVMVAVLLVVPVPPFDEVIAPVVLLLTPGVMPVTSTVIVQFPPAPTVPPLKLIVDVPAVAVTAPPQLVLVLGELATRNPAGRLSVKATPASASVPFGFEIVNVSVAVPFNGTVGAENCLAIVGAASTVTVAVLLTAPGPLSVDVTAPVVLFFTPAVTPVTVTLKVQLVPAPIEPPARVIVLGAVLVRVPPPHVVEVPLATVNPAGSVSVKPTPVISNVFELVIVNVSEVVAPIGIVAAPNALVIVGGEATDMLALAVLPVPPLVDVTAPVTLFLRPCVAPVTVTLIVQVPLAAIVPPLNVMMFGEVVVKVPPQTLVGPAVGTVNPLGSVSVKATPVRPTVEFGFVKVNVRLVVPFSGTFAPPNAFAIVGGATTVIVAVLLAAPVPPLAEPTAPVVLFLTPAVAPVTVTVI